MCKDALTTIVDTVFSVGDDDGNDVVGGSEVHLPPGSDAVYKLRVGAGVVAVVGVVDAIHSQTSFITRR